MSRRTSSWMRQTFVGEFLWPRASLELASRTTDCVFVPVVYLLEERVSDEGEKDLVSPRGTAVQLRRPLEDLEGDRSEQETRSRDPRQTF